MGLVSVAISTVQDGKEKGKKSMGKLPEYLVTQVSQERVELALEKAGAIIHICFYRCSKCNHLERIELGLEGHKTVPKEDYKWLQKLMPKLAKFIEDRLCKLHKNQKPRKKDE